MNTVRIAAGLVIGMVLAAVAAAAPPETVLTWRGHSAFEVVTPKGAVLLIDPWLSNPQNPDVKAGKDPLAAVDRLDYILISHAHFDHVGDAVQLARRTGARLVATADVGLGMVKALGFPEDRVSSETLVKIGEEAHIAGGEVTVALTPAAHSVVMGLKKPGAGPGRPTVVYGTKVNGIVLAIDGGPTIYHTGDTAYFAEMADIGERYRPDVVLVNTDPYYGMKADAVEAMVAAVGAKLVVPHHYGTYAQIADSPAPVVERLTKRGVAVRVLRPGQSLRFRGRVLVE